MFNPKVSLFAGHPQVRDYTPGSAVNSGDVIVINGIAYFASQDIATGALGAVAFSGGIWRGNKVTGAIADGAAIFWDPTGSPVTGTASSGAFTGTYASGVTFVGFASAAALSADSYVYFEKATAGGSGLRTVAGQLTTVTASDTVVTGLNKVVSVVASLDDNPGDNPELVSASIGDQNGAPTAGSVLIKTWQNTSGSDPTPVAAGTFGKKVNWIAVGY